MDYYQNSRDYYKNQQYQSSNYNYSKNKPSYAKKKGDIFSDIASEYSAKEETTSTSEYDNYNYNYDQSYYNKETSKYNKFNYSKDYYGGNYYKVKPGKAKYHKKNTADQSIDLMEIKKYLKNLEFNEKTVHTVIDLFEGNLDCLICNEVVNTKNEIWQCSTCFKLIHLKCIKEWINKLNKDDNEKSDLKWTCPGCNTNYIQKDEPVYDCYCGKYNKVCKNKDFDPSKIVIPHSCGFTCDKLICKHLKCYLPCHPGNHITCNIIEKIYCFCGKTCKEIPCINPNKRVMCNNVCEKKLYCGKHVCKVKCHEDDCTNYLRNKQCQDCLNDEKKKFAVFLQQLEKMIFSQTQQKVILTNVLNDYIFEGLLPCKIHYEPLKTESNLKFILKLVQVSGDKLADNIRKFIPICEKTIENSCQCKNRSTDTLCYKLKYPHDLMDYLFRSKQIEEPVQNCTKVCNTKKTCKNHVCNRICCELRSKKIKNYSLDDPNGYHICMLTCGKTLNCAIHKCMDFCHKNACKPCATIIRDKVLYCECGKTKLDPPYVCGSEPKCNFPCTKERECEHPCKKTCHKGDCGFCNELTFKQCRCGKEVIQNVVCGESTIPSCGKPCYEILECNVHFCQEICHVHNFSLDYQNKENFCGSVCGREFKLCEHTCPNLCHGESECKEFNCVASVKIFCPCKINSKIVKCIDLKRADNKPEALVSCNEECRKHERLKKIELAFEGLLKISQEKYPHYYEKKNLEEIKNEEGITISHTDTKYDINMLNFAKRNVKLIIKVETIVENALKNQTSTHEIQNLDKKSFIMINDFLTIYYNLRVEKSKSNLEKMKNIIIKDASASTIPRYRLSLLALLFRNHYFMDDSNIYHPFEATIFMYNFRLQTKSEEIETFLVKYCEVNAFYLDLISMGKAYVHFFNKEIAEKVYNSIKSFPSQFQDCELKILHKKEDQDYFKKIYSYLKDQIYFNYVYELRDANFVHVSEKEKKEEKKDGSEVEKRQEMRDTKTKQDKFEVDEDGFVIIKSKKNK